MIQGALVVVGGFRGSLEVGLLRLLVGEVLRYFAQFFELRQVNMCPVFNRAAGLPHR
jgi:hypothetical protein